MIEHHASTYCLLTHTLNFRVGLKGKKKSECGHVSYQIKGKERSIDSYRSKHFNLTDTPRLWVWLKSNFDVVQISLFFIELSTEY